MIMVVNTNNVSTKMVHQHSNENQYHPWGGGGIESLQPLPYRTASLRKFLRTRNKKSFFDNF